MAISQADKQVKWSTNNTKSVTNATTETSDVITSSATEGLFCGMAKADNNGTPASGDVVDFYILKTFGDPDADPDTADEYPTSAYREFLCQVDTNIVDPGIATFKTSLVGVLSYKFEADNGAASNAITVSIGGQVVSS